MSSCAKSGSRSRRRAAATKPTKICGGVTLATGPEVAGTSLISVDGNVSYSFPQSSCGTPGVLDIEGAGALAGFPVANLDSRFTTDGQFTFKTVVASTSPSPRRSSGSTAGRHPLEDLLRGGQGGGQGLRLHDLQRRLDRFQHRRRRLRNGRPVRRHGLRVPLGESLGPATSTSRRIATPTSRATSRPPSRGPVAGAAPGRRAGRGKRRRQLHAAKGTADGDGELDGAGAAPGFSLSGPGGLKVPIRAPRPA